MTGPTYTTPLSPDDTPPLPPVLLRLPALVGAAVVLDHSGASVRILAAYSTGESEIDGHMALFVGWNMTWFDTLIEPLREMQGNQV